MLWEQRIQYASLSDVGFRRKNNEDACAVQMCDSQETWLKRGHLFVVCDGMGGHAVGELASKMACDTLPHTYFKLQDPPAAAALKEAIEVANRTINTRGSQNADFNEMGTTCSALALVPEGALIGHVGDSRVYRVRSGRIEQLTFDHSLHWELIRSGHLSFDDSAENLPRNVITRSLGPDEKVDVDVEGPLPVYPGDVYLICSDGLTGHIQDDEIGQIVSSLPPAEACKALISLTNLRGGSDNVTVVVCHVGDAPGGGGAVAAPPPPEPDERPKLGLPQIIALWLVAIGFVIGLSVALLNNPLAGSVIAGISVAAGTFLCWMWFRPQEGGPSFLRRGHVGDPYRKASAELSTEFLDELFKFQNEVRSYVRSEGWDPNDGALEKFIGEAITAREGNDRAAALAHLTNVLESLMMCIRKNRAKAAKKSSVAKPKEEPPSESVFDP